jgi:predicted Zn-dependent peptidase
VTVLVEPMEDVQSVAFSMLVPGGTIYEPRGVNGASAALADLVTRGAGDYSSRELHARLDQMGVQRSEINGWNFLSLSGALVAGHLASTLELYAEILLRARLPEEELEPTVIGVEQSLRALEDEPHRKVFVELRRSAYDDPWGRPAEGTLEDLPRITSAVMRSFYQNCFRPNASLIGVAGRVDPLRVIAQLERLLADWPPGELPGITPAPRQPAVRHLPHESAQTHIGLAWSAAPYGHPDYYAAWAAANILGGSSSSRLFTEVRERRGLCYSVSSSHNSLLTEGRVFTYVGTTTERAQQTLDVALAEIERLSAGVQPAELERCQANAKSALVMQQESTSARASAIARDWYYLGRVQTLSEVHQQVQSLTVEQVNDYLRRNPATDMSVITVGAQPLRAQTR